MSKIEVNEQAHAMRQALGIDGWGEDIMRIKNNLRTLNTNYRLLEQVVTDLVFDFDDLLERVSPMVEERELEDFDAYMNQLVSDVETAQRQLSPESKLKATQE